MIELMSKKYDEHSYHCVHFALDVWEELTGDDLRANFARLLAPLRECTATRECSNRFAEVPAPVNPCLVVMRNGARQPHLGVFVDGKVMHLQHAGPMAVAPHNVVARYRDVRYYACVS